MRDREFAERWKEVGGDIFSLCAADGETRSYGWVTQNVNDGVENVCRCWVLPC